MLNNEYEVREVRWEDIEHVAENMRPQDVDEVWAAAHLSPLEAIVRGFSVSRDTSFTGVASGEPVCIFGVQPPGLIGGMAVPWMLGSRNLNFHSRKFLRESRRMANILSEEFPVMENYVDARNTAAIRWLQWVGFWVYYPKPYGREGLPFHRFEMRK